MTTTTTTLTCVGHRIADAHRCTNLCTATDCECRVLADAEAALDAYGERILDILRTRHKRAIRAARYYQRGYVRLDGSVWEDRAEAALWLLTAHRFRRQFAHVKKLLAGRPA